MRRLFPLVVALILLGVVPVSWARAPQPPRTTISGFVRDAATGAPIANAQVDVGNIRLTSGPDGLIPVTEIELARAVEEMDVTVSAVSYSSWHLFRLVLRTKKPVELRVRLVADARAEPVTPEGAGAPARVQPGRKDSLEPSQGVINTPPEYIEIGRINLLLAPEWRDRCVPPWDLPEGTVIPVERMRFVDYIRDVLPNEWIASWPAASLDAGAVAAKQYAWYWAFVGKKWRGMGYDFDLLDSPCDQAYRPNSAVAATDAAVARTWFATLKRAGRIFPTYYRAWDRQCPVGESDCMGQYESAQKAQAGWSAEQILLHYYDAEPTLYSAPSLAPRAYLPLLSR